MTTFGILISSSRQGRVGKHVAAWARETLTAERPDITTDLIDLREIALPQFDEEQAPKSGAPKTTDHGRAWAERVAGLDAIIMLTPQYNGAYPGSLKNAIDWLYAEWVDLPTLLIGYGWGEAAESLPLLKTLMVRVGADVLDTIGLGFGEDLEADGTMHVADEKQTMLVSAIMDLEEKAEARGADTDASATAGA